MECNKRSKSDNEKKIKMNIAILTQSIKANYGSVLQNFALQTVLRKLGHEPITIDYRDSSPLWLYVLRTIKTCFMFFIPGHRRKFTSYRNVEKRDDKTMNFVRKYIRLTDEEYLKYKKSVIRKYSINAIIVGSDQVWRPVYNPYTLYDKYLDFVKNVNITKIAYAASFGTDVWEYNNKQRLKCKLLAKQFKAVSVRENSGIELCRSKLNVDAQEVLDPTLLLDREDYEKTCSCIPRNRERYVCCYILDMDNNKKALIENFAKKNNLSVICFHACEKAEYTIEEWLAMFRDATFVITDSFHGTVFSIIFHKEFYSIVNNERGGTRFTSLLSKFGLEKRLITELPYINDTINWEAVETDKKRWREKSLDFLEQNLH